MASDNARRIDFNHFEWILDNDAVIPVLLRWSKKDPSGDAEFAVAGDGSSGGLWSPPSPSSLVVPGAGSSTLEDFLPEVFSPVVGLDVDRAALQEAAERTRMRPDIRWIAWDLTVEGRTSEQEEIKPVAGAYASETLPETFDIILDKGTLDYVICEEIGKCCSYLRNMRTLLSSDKGEDCHASSGNASSGRVYVLISFRSRSLLLQLLDIFNFELLEEIGDLEVGSNNQQRAAIYVMRLRSGRSAEAKCREEEEKLFQEAMDLHYRDHSPLVACEGNHHLMSIETCSLEEAWRLLIPEEMQVEYDLALFREDLEASNPEALRRGSMTGAELVRFLQENQ